MNTTKEYMVISEFGEYAKFNESGIFICWTSEKCTTPHIWAAEIILVSNPGSRVIVVEAKKE